jgi:excisionase family DNA binding protein
VRSAVVAERTFCTSLSQSEERLGNSLCEPHIGRTMDQPTAVADGHARDVADLLLEEHDEPADDLRLITIPAAAERLDLSRSKVYLLIADGDLPTVRIGRARRICLADLRAFVERHRAG